MSLVFIQIRFLSIHTMFTFSVPRLEMSKSPQIIKQDSFASYCRQETQTRTVSDEDADSSERWKMIKAIRFCYLTLFLSSREEVLQLLPVKQTNEALTWCVFTPPQPAVRERILQRVNTLLQINKPYLHGWRGALPVCVWKIMICSAQPLTCVSHITRVKHWAPQEVQW